MAKTEKLYKNRSHSGNFCMVFFRSKVYRDTTKVRENNQHIYYLRTDRATKTKGRYVSGGLRSDKCTEDKLTAFSFVGAQRTKKAYV